MALEREVIYLSMMDEGGEMIFLEGNPEKLKFVPRKSRNFSENRSSEFPRKSILPNSDRDFNSVFRNSEIGISDSVRSTIFNYESDNRN